MPFEQWRDVGLSGYGFDGARRAGWRGRNEDRDVASVDGLYGTGLRLQEWGSVLDVELLRSSTARLFAGLAGGSVPEGGAKEGRWYRIPRAVLREVEGYADPLEGSRTEVIRRARRRGSYERLAYLRVVSGYNNTRSRVLYLEGGGSLSVWLSPNGLPKKLEGWEGHVHRGQQESAAGQDGGRRGGSGAAAMPSAYVPALVRAQVVARGPVHDA
ncbi:hypothetical protein ACFRFU_28380 [Streptomyces sp. NPDC056704]|uniref:hypothetical protein n=1 Tax=Streptomyces sp. NPDC056704 TaxID=3345917 RepID=UPI0036A996FB